MSILNELDTPAAILDAERMQRNVLRMQQHLDALGARFRPHVKTSKSLPVVAAQRHAGATGITVSTLREAEAFFEDGIEDILYAVGIAPAKLAQVLRLREQGCALKIITDNVDAAQAVAEFGRRHQHAFEVWIEIDVDGHRSGIAPESDLLIAVGQALHAGGVTLGGVMAHAGSSYEFEDPVDLQRIAEQERARTLRAAERLRRAGLPCAHVSIGSTPTALSVAALAGITEVRAGVYVFFDLVMHNVGVCRIDELALSVLTTVIGHQEDKGWAIVDAGWMAMSRDRGTQKQRQDFAYGQVCDLDGTPIAGYLMTGANQEHGIISLASGRDDAIAKRFPVGTRLRVLPNHACATAAQYPAYTALLGDGRTESWPRLHGW